MTPNIFKMQSHPDGREGHIEREAIRAHQHKVDVKKLKKKYIGRKIRYKGTKRKAVGDQKFEERRLRITKYVDPTTLVLPTECKFYKPGCTFHNCDGCARIKKEATRGQIEAGAALKRMRRELLSTPMAPWEILVWEKFKREIENGPDVKYVTALYDIGLAIEEETNNV